MSEICNIYECCIVIGTQQATGVTNRAQTDRPIDTDR